MGRCSKPKTVEICLKFFPFFFKHCFGDECSASKKMRKIFLFLLSRITALMHTFFRVDTCSRATAPSQVRRRQHQEYTVREV